MGEHAREDGQPRHDADGAVIEVSYVWDLGSDALSLGAAAAAFGRDPATLASGRALAVCIEPGSGRSPYDTLSDLAGTVPAEGASYQTRYVLRLSKEHVFAVDDVGRCFAGPDGRAARAHGVLHARALAAGVSTGPLDPPIVPRQMLVRRLDAEIRANRTTRRSLAVVLIAISGLGPINDEIGDEATDEVIRNLGRRLSGVLRGSDSIIRYSGNRYAAVLSACTRDEVGHACDRFRRVIESSPVDSAAGPVGLHVVMGAAMCPEHAPDASSLLTAAEEALRHARGPDGATGTAVFDRSMRRSPVRPQNALLAALNERRVRLACQPIVDARTGDVAFEEGLVRIVDEAGTIVGAGDIVPIAEKGGLVKLLDQRVMELAVQRLAARPTARMSINASPLSLVDTAWLDALAAHVGSHPGVAERMIIEITETAAIEDPATLGARLDFMKALGVMIGIDDFGAGHTSFRHLRHYPIDYIKIEGSFIRSMCRSQEDAFFVRTLVDLAQNLGVATVAEWVEDDATADALRRIGVDYLQGSLFGAALLEEVAEADAPVHATRRTG